MCLLKTIVKQLIIGALLIFVLFTCPVYAAEQSAGTLPLTITITNILATNIARNGATITWQTSYNATSQVYYDIVSHAHINEYTYYTYEDTSLVTDHSMALIGLNPSTTYHYRVRSTMDGVEPAISSDKTFTTSAPSTPPAIGGGGAAPPTPGCTEIRDFITTAGVFRQDVIAKSEDGKVSLTISKDTTAKNEYGITLTKGKMCILEVEEPPAPPAGATIFGTVYELGPDGTTFDPAATLTITYDPAEISGGYREQDMVIAVWDEVAGEWVELEGCVVNAATRIITATLSRLSTIAVLSYPRPAAFFASILTISPPEANIGQSVTISALIANVGHLQGSHTVTLKINGAVAAKKSVTLAGGASQTVTFTTVEDTAGTYTVNLDGLSGKFTVETQPLGLMPAAFTTSALTIYPTEVEIGETVTINVSVANTGDLEGSYEVVLKINNIAVATEDITVAGGASQIVTFTTVEDAAGTYTISVDGLSGTFTVRAPEEIPVKPSTNWLLIGGIIGAVTALGTAASIVVRTVWMRGAG